MSVLKRTIAAVGVPGRFVVPLPDGNVKAPVPKIIKEFVVVPVGGAMVVSKVKTDAIIPWSLSKFMVCAYSLL